MHLSRFILSSKRHPAVHLSLAIPFFLIHLACFFVFWTGVTKTSLVLCFSLYVLRMWAVTAGYHRYFSHKSFQTSRLFQFILAFLAQSSLQRGVLQWANDHRKHHLNSDTVDDIHSSRVQGFLYAHLGWIFAKERYDSEYCMAQDFKKYPELVWLDKFKHLPGILLAIFTWLIGGWSGLIVGFFVSTVLVFHCTFLINSLTHQLGSQRYLTGDDSRNHWLLAILTFGEGWHNNHHYYPASARQGFFWWEIDITYYSLKLLERLNIIWDLKTPPSHVIYSENSPPSRAVNYSLRYLKNAGLDFSVIINQLESIKNKTSSENIHQNLTDVCEMLSQQLHKIKNLPPKLKVCVKNNLENSIQLLTKIIHHPNEYKVEIINEVLQLINLKIFSKTKAASQSV